MRLRSSVVLGCAVCLLSIAAGAAGASEPALWLRTPAISPDGETIAFSYHGDIYLVSAKGGATIPLTTLPSAAMRFP